VIISHALDKSANYCERGKVLLQTGNFIEALFDFSLAIKLEIEKQDKDERQAAKDE